MNLSRFFIDRPVFAIVLSIFILVLGLAAYVSLPVSQYPEVAPPTIVIQATYPGATAQTIADTVAAPIEQEVNGVEGMMYMYSQSTNDGRMTLNITFKLGTNIDDAQVLVQNRVAIVQPRLPEEVRRLGLVTQKASPDILMVVHLLSPQGTYDQLYISNYALLQVRDRLARIDGIGSVQMFGARDYSMRVWLDPDRMAALNLTGQEVIAALRAENVQVAGGSLGQPPTATTAAFQTSLTLQGRLTEASQFENVIVKTGEQGRITRLKDVARVELGARDYVTNSYLNGQTAVAMVLAQRPGSNALATADSVKAAMADLSKDFPNDLTFRIVYNPTEFIAQSIEKLRMTIFEAIALVVLVVMLFLQSWRAAFIPIIAIPVSLIGTFAVMALLGFSINNLSLFGLVLAVGIVVDDAIVVVENVERNMAAGMSPHEAARRTMDEIGTALISIALVLGAVFVPAAFLPGISGAFYRQFAVTIAVATLISAFVSLTLSPALSARMLRVHVHSTTLSAITSFFDAFNRGFENLSNRYGHFVEKTAPRHKSMIAIYIGLIVIAGVMLWRIPVGFIPAQDAGYFITALQLPEGASLSRTDEVMRRAEQELLKAPGVEYTVTFAGFSGATRTNATNAGAIFVGLEPFDQRLEEGLTGPGILNDLRQRMGAFREAFIVVLQPPPVQGIGTAGGFALRVQDKFSRGSKELNDATWALAGAANREPVLSSVYSPFQVNSPQLFVDVDRTRAQILDVPISNISSALETFVGSAYVNDFNLFGRTFRVTAQADAPFRMMPEDIARIRTRSATGAMVPLGSVVDFSMRAGPDRVPRYNGYAAAEINGDVAPGASTGQALDAMERLAAQVLPAGFSIEWTDLSYEQRQAGNTALIVFAFAVLCVFLTLAAQYESWSLPFAILLIVPMCLFSAAFGLLIRGIDNNILTQIGLVVLVGLAAKNAILIVEFARQLESQGRDRFAAAVEACRLRLRPILMTSFAFILGVVPLATATGAGAEMRQAIGTAVFFGMIGVTIFGLVFTPVFYTLIRGWSAKAPAPEAPASSAS